MAVNCDTKITVVRNWGHWQNLLEQFGLAVSGIDCGSFGPAVASDTRGSQFKSSHPQNFEMNTLTVEKTKIKKNVVGNGQFLNKPIIYLDHDCDISSGVLQTSDCNFICWHSVWYNFAQQTWFTIPKVFLIKI